MLARLLLHSKAWKPRSSISASLSNTLSFSDALLLLPCPVCACLTGASNRSQNQRLEPHKHLPSASGIRICALSTTSVCLVLPDWTLGWARLHHSDPAVGPIDFALGTASSKRQKILPIPPPPPLSSPGHRTTTHLVHTTCEPAGLWTLFSPACSLLLLSGATEKGTNITSCLCVHTLVYIHKPWRPNLTSTAVVFTCNISTVSLVSQPIDTHCFGRYNSPFAYCFLLAAFGPWSITHGSVQIGSRLSASNS